MFERFKDSARRVLFYARFEAARRGSSTLSTEHLLLGLLAETEPPVKDVLERCGVAVASLVSAAETALPPGDSSSAAEELPLSEGAKRCLHHALAEATRLGSEGVEAEHLLLGVAAVQDSTAANLLRQHGAGFDQLRAHVEVVSALRPPRPAAGALGALTMQGSIRSIERITFNDDVMDGIGCVRHTGTPAGLVVELVAAGMTTEQILAAMPLLEREDIRQALKYAAALAMQAR